MERRSALRSRMRTLGRRDFVVATLSTAVALALPWRASASAAVRRLRMSNTHTDERLDVVYFDGGALVEDALSTIDRFLRDVRTGDVHRIDPGVLDIAWSLAQAVGRPLGTFEIVDTGRVRRW
jgi:uncharacterized protein YcbK (DUF882 family)